MEKIKFDDGTREYEINGDPNRLLKFNPSDLTIIERYEDAKKELKVLEEKYKDTKLEPNAETIELLRNETLKLFDKVFYEGAGKIVFGDVHPLTMVNGNMVFENFCNAIAEVIRKERKEQLKKQQKIVQDYKKAHDRITTAHNKRKK